MFLKNKISIRRLLLCGAVLFSLQGFSQQFPCDGKLYYFGNTNGQNYLSYIDGYTTGNPTIVDACPLLTITGQNALAANPIDNYLYFVADPLSTLYRMDANCNTTAVCAGVVATTNKGCFDHLGRFWIMDTLNQLIAYDLNTCTQVKGPFPVASIIGVDIAFNVSDCHFYMADSMSVLKIDTNGIIVATYTPGYNAGASFGGISIGADGHLYGLSNNSVPGKLYQFNTQTQAPGGLVYTFPANSSTANPCGCDMASFPCPDLRSAFTNYPLNCGLPRAYQFTSQSVGLVNTWVWDFGDGTVDSVNLNPAHTYTAAGTYTVSLVIHALSKCLYIAPDTLSTALIVVPALNAAPASSNISCKGANNGSASVTPAGGFPPYFYSWSNGATTSSISNLTPGTYSVTVSDAYFVPTGTELISNNDFTAGNTGFTSGYTYCSAAGCLVPEGLYSVGTNPTFYHASFTGADHTTGQGNFMIVNGDSTGQTVWSQTVTGVLPNTNYTFSTWVSSVFPISPAQLQFSINNVPLGTPFVAPPTTGVWQQFYTVWNSGSSTSALLSILNLNPTAQGNDFGLDDISFQECTLCPATATITITEPTTLTSAGSSTDPLCNGNSDGTAIATPSGGTPGYTYVWNNGQSSQTATGLTAGSYSVTVIDQNGCSSQNTYSLTQPALLTASVTSTNILCNGDSSTASAIAAGGSPGYTYQWSHGPTSASVSGLIAANYSVIVTDLNGCANTQTLSITAPPLLTSSLTQSAILCNGGTANAGINTSGGTPGYTYSWSNGQTTSAIAGISAGNYSVSITDSNGCTNTHTLSVTEPAPLILSSACSDSICEGDSTLISVTPNGGTPVYTYVWLPVPQSGSAFSVSPNSTTVYSVTVTDANGCVSAMQTCTVAVLPEPNALFDTISNGQYGSIYSFNDNSTGGTSWYWDFGDGNTSNEQNPIHTFPGAGTYTVTQVVYNQFGCPDTFQITVDFEEGIIIPNVFTPDGDGVNDVWFIASSGLKEYHIAIYDRWGLKVFESTADQIRWDGRSTAGVLLSDGTYYYVLTAVLKSFKGDKDYSTKGYVSLLTTQRKQ